MKLKFYCMSSIVLLYTDVLGMQHFDRNYNYGQQQNYFQRSNRGESNGRYDGNNYDYKGKSRLKRNRGCYNNYGYTDYDEKPRSRYYKDSYNDTPNFYKKMIKKRKMLDKEQEGTDALFDNYNYWGAFNFFKQVSKSESSYPALEWDDNEIDSNRLYRVNFGEFDQRQKFIDMFENYDGKGISNCMWVDFSYGGYKHDMFMEQRREGDYNSDSFLFQNCVTFGENQPIDKRSYLKPYLSRKDKTGILEKFIKYPEKIQSFAINVLRIMKLSSKGILPIDKWNFNIDRVLTFEAFEVAGMILSTERLRSKKSLLLACIEFYKLKHTEGQEGSLSMLLDMFDKDGPILRFPASPGGIKEIQKTHPNYIYKRFLNMIKYSPEYPIIQQCKNRDIQRELMDKFFQGKLERIRAVLENRTPKFKSEFKSAVQNYLQGLNSSRIKEINADTHSYAASSSNTNLSTVLPNESSSKDANNTNLEVENNPDEYFDGLNDLTDADYDSIFNKAVSSEFGSSQQDIDRKSENNPDEDFGGLDDFTDADYDSIFNKAVLSLGSSQQDIDQKSENNPDEYFDDLDNLSEIDYDSIVNKAVFDFNLKTKEG